MTTTAQHPTHGQPYLHAKIRIGTCKGPVNFRAKQNVFLQSDVRGDVWERKDDVLSWKKSRILSTHELWNKSVPRNLHPVPESRQRENYVKDRSNAFTYNYRAESLDPVRMDEPIDKPTKFHISRTSSSAALATQMKLLHDPIQRGQLRRTQEIPVNITLDDKRAWNSATSVSYKDRDRNLDGFTAKSMRFTKRVSTAMAALDYTNPVKAEAIYHATLRRQKTAGTFTPATFVDGVDRRPVDPKDLTNRYAIEPPRKYSVVEHSGTWELLKGDNKYGWSDTASFALASPGDVVRKKSLDAKSYFGPENLYRQHSLAEITNPIPTPPRPRSTLALSASDLGLRVGR
jgi:hypothetical protein